MVSLVVVIQQWSHEGHYAHSLPSRKAVRCYIRLHFNSDFQVVTCRQQEYSPEYGKTCTDHELRNLPCGSVVKEIREDSSKKKKNLLKRIFIVLQVCQISGKMSDDDDNNGASVDLKPCFIICPAHHPKTLNKEQFLYTVSY